MVALLSLVTLAATAFGLVSANPIEARQEALRFGVVNVNPTTVKVNEVGVNFINPFLLLLSVHFHTQDADIGFLGIHRHVQLHAREVPARVCGFLHPGYDRGQRLCPTRVPAPALVIPGRCKDSQFPDHRELPSVLLMRDGF